MRSLVHSFKRPGSSAIWAAVMSIMMLPLVGCGSGYGVYPETALEANERMIRVRGALERVKSDPLANEVRLDLQRAEQFLVTAEAATKDDKPDERVDLYLTTAEGQVSLIQTYYARRRAEDKLTSRREQAFGQPQGGPPADPNVMEFPR